MRLIKSHTWILTIAKFHAYIVIAFNPHFRYTTFCFPLREGVSLAFFFSSRRMYCSCVACQHFLQVQSYIMPRGGEWQFHPVTPATTPRKLPLPEHLKKCRKSQGESRKKQWKPTFNWLRTTSWGKKRGISATSGEVTPLMVIHTYSL